MNPKSLFAFVLVSLMAVSFATAAPDDKADKKGKGKGGVFAKLDLSKEQKAQIKEIQKATRAAVKEAGDDKDAKKAAAKAGREKTLAVLTDEQKEKLKKLMAEGKKKGPKKDKKKKDS